MSEDELKIYNLVRSITQASYIPLANYLKKLEDRIEELEKKHP